MKNIKKASLVLALVMCTACSKDNSSKDQAAESNVGSPITISQDERNQRADQLNEFYEIRYLVSNHMMENKGVKLDIETKINWGDTEYSLKQSNFENYDEGRLTGFYSQRTTSNSQIKESYYFDGEKNYKKINNEGWNELASDQVEVSLFINYLKIISEDPSIWQISKNDETVTISREINDPELLKNITSTVAVPLELSPEADVESLLTYEADGKTGAINNLKMDIKINDLDQEYSVSVNAPVTYTDEEVSVDLEEEAVYDVDKEASLADQFEKANPTSSYNHYDMSINYSENLDAGEYMYAMNYVTDKPHLSYEITFENEEISKVIPNMAGLPDYYKNFVVYFQANAKDAKKLEGSEEGTETYRIMGNDFSELSGLADGIDLSGLDSSDRQYGIDYTLDSNTKRLRQVFVWSAAKDGDNIDDYVVFSFVNFNNRWNNLARYYIDEAAWKDLGVEDIAVSTNISEESQLEAITEIDTSGQKEAIKPNPVESSEESTESSQEAN